MRFAATLSRTFLFATALGLAACSATTSDDETVAGDNAFTSNDANIVELSFEGTVIADKRDTPKKAIAAQLIYMQGALTSDVRGNAQAGMPKFEVLEDRREGRTRRIRYSAKVAAAWPKRTTVPTSYEVVVPLDTTKLAAFNAKYDGKCGNNEYGRETFWHDWNPKAQSCVADAGDVLRVTANVRPHPQETRGKAPEYDKIWEDGSLDVVAVYGIISSNTPNDEGARGREQLLSTISASLRDATRTEGPQTSGVIAESTVSGKITIAGAERTVNVTAFLVQEAASAGSAFYSRYTAATEKADVVVYEGHSGLGKNVNALATNMGARAGKYQLVYMYGCQTLGYLGPDMHEKRTALNGAANDPDGTKFLDVIATGLPAYGDNGRSTNAIYRAIVDAEHPKTFNDLLQSISSLHLAVVFGEDDNP